MRTHNGPAAALRIAIVIALAMMLLGGARNVVADDTATVATNPTGAGMRVYRDPETGEFTSPPPDAELPPAARSLRTNAPALVETPGTGPAGGVTIDLRGAFQSSITATADTAGVRTDCHSETSGATPK